MTRYNFIYRFLTVFLWGAVVFSGARICAQIPYPTEKDLHSPFIDSIIGTFSVEDMAAQTMVIRSKAVPTPEYIVQMRQMLEKNPYGGICFFAGTTPDMLTLQQVYKNASHLPLLITIDGEFGPGMRMTDIIKFPRQQTLGAVSNPELIYEMGHEVGRQCRLLGIQWNFLPVVDVNNNALNPVINTRSFGEDPAAVARLAGLYLRGMQEEGIMGSIKHFPGHGDTKTDSHLALPLIELDRETLEKIHLQPFKDVMAEGVESVMVGHLNIPAYDSSGLPSSLSPLIVQKLLREEMGFRGLIVTDGLEMQGVRKALRSLPAYKNLGEGAIEVQALTAGCDVLLLPQDPVASIKAIAAAVKTGKLRRERLEEACRRILYYKFYPVIADNYPRYPTTEAMHGLPRFMEDSINSRRVRQLQQSLYDHALTLVDNINHVLPLSRWSPKNKIALHVGNGKNTEFARSLSGFDPDVEHVFIDKNFDQAKLLTPPFLKRISEKGLIIISITNTNYTPSKSYGITEQTVQMVSTLQELGIPMVLCVFSSPYALKPFYEIPNILATVCGYQETEESQKACARLLYGALPATGHLPVSVAPYWPAGFGINTAQQILDYRRPEDVGIENARLNVIDSLALLGLEAKAYPGCQILIAKKGNVIYDKCFGRATYDSLAPEVQPNSLYDLASLTKVLATTLVYMRLYENGCYNLDEPIRNFVPRLQQTNKKYITFRQALSHQAGLKAFIPYAEPEEKHNGKPLFDSVYSSAYPLEVADRLYLQRGYAKEIQKRIDESPVNTNRPYVYSDLGFYYLNEALQKMADTGRLEVMTHTDFYQYLGLETLGFHPRDRFPAYRIMPTENDTTFRHRLIRGYVHDPLGALLGGVSGNAGLFGNSYDVAVIGQMLLQNGFYGGIQFFDSTTVALFTSSSFSPPGNRRGGGFDKPALKKGEKSPTAESASPGSYGHSGFTGTYIWVDPEKETVYVFLSNRVHPGAGNKKLSQMNLRTAILEAVYNL